MGQYLLAEYPHEACGARLLSYTRQPAGSKLCQPGSADWLLRELQLRGAYGDNGAPRPVVLIVSGV